MRNIKQFESFSKEKEIHDICEEYDIKNYTINDDLSINVKGSVYLNNKGLTELPLVFNIVKDYFYYHNNSLNNLKGAPRKCEKFYCHNNNLTSLEGAPEECFEFDCMFNNLTSLKGAPRKCVDFYCLRNKLTNLEGAPEECKYFDCEANKLISLKGAPRKCSSFHCGNNPKLRTLENIPSINNISINNTAISSFEHLPNSFKIRPNDKLKYICKLIYKDIDYNIYILDEMNLFNDYRIIDDKDYVDNKADKATLNMFKLKDFLEELKIDKEIDIKELENHFYIK